ncbi:MAG: hypothetical protein A2Y57_00020 [Candidatus Woykebacteria bacterium RBG_13_40_7b]|uniref:Uncharacterized protein n=1 Tax=Candidatus Woykebacteria bacterium RBG_13_40_7b TaxID=1802594 RepID=A0A1G1W6Z2_9BACT|nr:MAG: hypothetical protein A2Y57_00020 [Candidatus Woykebacteria bacterium RBG_13_40_7b]
MLTTPHLLVGAAIGSQLNNPFLIAPAAVGSHFVLDALPHFQGNIDVEDLKRKDILLCILDCSLALLILVLLSLNNPRVEYLWLGAFSAIAPDFHNLVKFLFGVEKIKRYDRMHTRFHFKKEMRLIFGLGTQLLTILLALIIIRFHPHLKI